MGGTSSVTTRTLPNYILYTHIALIISLFNMLTTDNKRSSSLLSYKTDKVQSNQTFFYSCKFRSQCCSGSPQKQEDKKGPAGLKSLCMKQVW